MRFQHPIHRAAAACLVIGWMTIHADLAAQQSCKAAFTADPTSGCAPLKVTFTDQSIDAFSWWWTFPGGYPATATGRGPHVIDYSGPGTYGVTLIIQCRSQELDTLSLPVLIQVDRCPSTVGDTVWNDLNANGIQETGEPGFPGVQVSLYRNDGSLLGHTTTDADGRYRFEDLDYGYYFLLFDAPPGTALTLQDQGGDDALDSDADPVNGRTDVFTLQSNRSEVRMDAGLVQQTVLNLDFGDAPKPYPTLLADDGARHERTVGASGVILGFLVDIEKDGIPETAALGDDLDGTDDEDGVAVAAMTPSSTATASVTASGPAYLNAWIDFNADGDWSDAGEQIVSGTAVAAGVNSLSFIVPATAVAGPTIARFRLSSTATLSFTGLARDGEVEDIQVRIGPRPNAGFDLGDAPDGSNGFSADMTAYPAGGPLGVPAAFPTVFWAGSPPAGPRHQSPRAVAFLGLDVTLEAEADSGPDEDGSTNLLPAADVPDRDGADDGVEMPLSLPSCTSAFFNYTVTFVQGNRSMFVNVWFDWNRDGDWDDSTACPTGPTAFEWTVQNQIVSSPAAGVYTFSTPHFTPFHPLFTTPQPVWMRITLSEQPWNPEWLVGRKGNGCGPFDRIGYEYGETEDYYFVPLTGQDLDFGDAPAPYSTLSADGGPSHFITPGLCLGASIDPEHDGQPDPDAHGDDTISMDDEDGVAFPSPIVPGGSSVVSVTVTGRGFLNAWIDFNQDGDWNDVSEKIIDERMLATGTHELGFPVPASASSGVSYSRFRFSQAKGLGISGDASNGEVEDYPVAVSDTGNAPVKWNQPPLKYRDTRVPGLMGFRDRGWGEPSFFGHRIVADDWICRDPRPVTGVQFWGAYAGWDSTAPPPEAPSAFHIGIWTDTPRGVDTSFSHPGRLIRVWKADRSALGETVANSLFLDGRMQRPDTCFQYTLSLPPAEWFYQEGDSTVYWLSVSALYSDPPLEHVWGWTSREHYFHDDAVVMRIPSHPAVDSVYTLGGSMEPGWDVSFILHTDRFDRTFDWGDAPDPDFPVRAVTNGAQHFIESDIRLGSSVDAEPDGQPSANASGDGGDEDGVSLDSYLFAGALNTCRVTASRAGFLNAWIDFNGNGSWDCPEEQILLNAHLNAGTNTLQFGIPRECAVLSTFGRFRFSSEADLKPFGLAIDGEVEDALINIRPGAIETGEGVLPFENHLTQNYPNPFNPSTRIEFSLARAGHVKLSVCDLMGREIAVLAEKSMRAGNHAAVWDGRDGSGRPVPGGLYLCRIEAPGFTQTRKLVLVK